MVLWAIAEGRYQDPGINPGHMPLRMHAEPLKAQQLLVRRPVDTLHGTSYRVLQLDFGAVIHEEDVGAQPDQASADNLVPILPAHRGATSWAALTKGLGEP